MENEKKSRKTTRNWTGPHERLIHKPKEVGEKTTLFVFRAKDEVADAIKAQPNRTQFITRCIKKFMGMPDEENQYPIIAKGVEIWPASQVEPMNMKVFEQRVACGYPAVLDGTERAQTLNLMDIICPHPESNYLVRVTGDSMTGSDVWPGDVLVVDKSNRMPSANEIALCELNGEYTAKYVRRHDGKYWLVPDNPNYHEVEIKEYDSFSVWGVVTYVLHKPKGRKLNDVFGN